MLDSADAPRVSLHTQHNCIAPRKRDAERPAQPPHFALQARGKSEQQYSTLCHSCTTAINGMAPAARRICVPILKQPHKLLQQLTQALTLHCVEHNLTLTRTILMCTRAQAAAAAPNVPESTCFIPNSLLDATGLQRPLPTTCTACLSQPTSVSGAPAACRNAHGMVSCMNHG